MCLQQLTTKQNTQNSASWKVNHIHDRHRCLVPLDLLHVNHRRHFRFGHHPVIFSFTNCLAAFHHKLRLEWLETHLLRCKTFSRGQKFPSLSMRISRTYKTIHFGMNYQHNTLVTSRLFVQPVTSPEGKGRGAPDISHNLLPWGDIS